MQPTKIPMTDIPAIPNFLRILTIPEKFTPVSEKNGEQTHHKDLLPLLKESRPVLIICMVRFVQNIATGLGVGTYYWQYIGTIERDIAKHQCGQCYGTGTGVPQKQLAQTDFFGLELLLARQLFFLRQFLSVKMTNPLIQ